MPLFGGVYEKQCRIFQPHSPACMCLERSRKRHFGLGGAVPCHSSPLLSWQPTGVFSRLGDLRDADEDQAPESEDDDNNSSSSSVLQYAGVLKKFFKPTKPQQERTMPGVPIRARATSSEAQLLPAAAPPAQRLVGKSPASPMAPAKEKSEGAAPSSVAKRLGKRPPPAEAQDSSVTSSKSKPESRFRVTIKRTLGSAKVSSTTETPSAAQMDHTGTISVFKRLGRKTV